MYISFFYVSISSLMLSYSSTICIYALHSPKNVT